MSEEMTLDPKSLISEIVKNLEKLAEKFQASLHGESEKDIEVLVREREEKIEELKNIYQQKIEKIRQPGAETSRIVKEARRQMDGLRGLKDSFDKLGIPYERFSISLPEDFLSAIMGQDAEHGEAETRQHAPHGKEKTKELTRKFTSPEVSELPEEKMRELKTIEQFIEETFRLNQNRPMRPREIIAFMVKDLNAYQSEASIRTQLFNLLRRGMVDQDPSTKCYKWVGKIKASVQ